MKLIIAGSRYLNVTSEFIQDLLDKYELVPNYIICGEAKGIDTCGKYWAIKNNISYISFKPDWNQFGDAAGPIRNKQMAKEGDALLLIWDGKSKGSANMRHNMNKLKKPVFEYIIYDYITSSL